MKAIEITILTIETILIKNSMQEFLIVYMVSLFDSYIFHKHRVLVCGICTVAAIYPRATF